MSINVIKADNLMKLLNGLFLLEDRDQEQIVSVVDALDFAYEKGNMVVDTGSCEKQRCVSL